MMKTCEVLGVSGAGAGDDGDAHAFLHVCNENCRQTERARARQIDRRTDGRTDRQTGRQAGRQADRQTDSRKEGQTDRRTHVKSGGGETGSSSTVAWKHTHKTCLISLYAYTHITAIG